MAGNSRNISYFFVSSQRTKGRLFHTKKALCRSVITKLVDQPRFASRLCVLRPGLVGAAVGRTRFHD